MSKSNTFEYYVLAGALTATPFPQVWDNASSSALTATWVSLHTADPADAGLQGTSEVSLTGYARVSVTRSTAGWSISTAGGNASPVAAIDFPQLTSTSTGTATHFSVGLTSASTSGTILYSGTITPNISLGQNVTARLTTGSSITED